jgi:ubiquinone/menaquinone biosynthesis C-methylase UbiE
MAETYFDPGEQRASKVHSLFSRIAPRYDLLNDLQSFGLHRYWKRRLIEMACPQPGQRALDLCCGTGDLALALARRGAHVTGLDFSERMLEVAIMKAEIRTPKSEGNPRQNKGKECNRCSAEDHSRFTFYASRPTLHAPPPPRYLCGDAQRLPCGDDSFDIVTIGYGLRNLASLETGLSEILRVLKPGGRLLALDFGKPDNPLWRSLYFGYLRLFVPCLGLMFAGSAAAYRYILESLHHYPAQHGVAAKMRELGWANVRIVTLLGGVMSINYGEKLGST